MYSPPETGTRRLVAVMKKTHKLGFGNGRVVEYEDGTAAWIASASLTQAFRVKISDVTGFSVTNSGKLLQRQLNILGNGTLLGAAEVNHGTAEVIEKWFRSHPDFGKNATPGHAASQSGSAPSIADEIERLARLREEGLLTDEEFAAAKQQLIRGS
jgi:hypothetical protein